MLSFLMFVIIININFSLYGQTKIGVEQTRDFKKSMILSPNDCMEWIPCSMHFL